MNFGQNAEFGLTLEEAQNYAIEHNKELKNIKADIKLSEVRIKNTRAQGLPQLQGSMDYRTNFNYEVQFSASTSGEPTIPDINYDVLDQGDQEVLAAIQQMMAPSGPAIITMKDQANASVQLSQLIFSGQYLVGLETAKIVKELSEKQYLKSEKDIKERVANIYYLILISENSLDIINKNIENLQKVLEHTKNMYNSGMVEKSDVDQIKVNLSKLKNSRESTRRNIQLNYNLMRIQLGITDNRNIQLTNSLTEFLDDRDISLLNTNFDMDKNITYQIMENQEMISKQQVKLQKWTYAPTLSGFYSYTEKLLTTDFDLSPKNAAGVTLSIPLYSGGSRKAQLDEARINLDKTKRQKSLLADQLKMQERQLRYDLQSAFENYKTQKDNVEVAKSLYENFANKYQQGMISSLDLTQANNNYLQAEGDYLSSVLKLLQARLALKKLYDSL
jgi:outer membrane protein TolC